MPTSKITYLGELRTEAVHLQSGTQIVTDAPVDNHGKGEAFSPTDLTATSLGSCAMTIMGITARRDEIDFTGSTIEVTKIMSAELPRRIVKIEVNFNMQTPEELSEEVKQKYIRVAHTCPVALSLHPDIEQVFNFNWYVAETV
ncbi:OsmC family protein [Emticicia sp. TH156]|uniref:OsmC family protein n=1 Tax=Emticicia sp. TH156 TaxID=2067454 RepID=UPI000C76DBCD|nr:OsmC family protein [Emticicia sp. TH156]PLK45020.1 osmotically inducible protein OsmC [Emticicia sp. TH156]